MSVEVKLAVKALHLLTKVPYSVVSSTFPLFSAPPHSPLFPFSVSHLQALQAFQPDRQPVAPSSASPNSRKLT